MHHFTCRGIESKGETSQYCKSHNFCNSTDFSLGYIEERSCKFWKFSSNFMKSFMMIVKTLSENITIFIIFAFVLVKSVFFD